MPQHWWGPFTRYGKGSWHMGGIAAGTAVGIWRLKRSGTPVAAFMDAAAPVLVAQSIGRVGNHFNQELFRWANEPAVGC